MKGFFFFFQWVENLTIWPPFWRFSDKKELRNHSNSVALSGRRLDVQLYNQCGLLSLAAVLHVGYKLVGAVIIYSYPEINHPVELLKFYRRGEGIEATLTGGWWGGGGGGGKGRACKWHKKMAFKRNIAQLTATFTSALNFHPKQIQTPFKFGDRARSRPHPFTAIDVTENHHFLMHLLCILLSVPCPCLFGGCDISVGEPRFSYPPLCDFCWCFLRPKQTAFSVGKA